MHAETPEALHRRSQRRFSMARKALLTYARASSLAVKISFSFREAAKSSAFCLVSFLAAVGHLRSFSARIPMVHGFVSRVPIERVAGGETGATSVRVVSFEVEKVASLVESLADQSSQASGRSGVSRDRLSAIERRVSSSRVSELSGGGAGQINN